MTDARLEEIIGKAVNQAVSEVVKTLKSTKMLTPPHTNPFKKTEQVLYALPKIKEIVADKREEIGELEQYGLRQKSKSITQFSAGGGGINDIKLPSELVKEKIQQLNAVIEELDRHIQNIESALDTIADEKWYCIIEMRYFENKGIEEIAATLNCDPSTVTRQKNKMVNTLKMELFPMESVAELVM
jgi:DNA-directed RNA polymerase specialized sigma subunit